MKRILTFLISATMAIVAFSQTTTKDLEQEPDVQYTHADSLILATIYHAVEMEQVPYDTVMSFAPLSKIMFSPAVYTAYKYQEPLEVFKHDRSGSPALHWLDDLNARSDLETRMLQSYMFEHPDLVRYNISFLPEAPKEFRAEVDPRDHMIKIHEVKVDSHDIVGAPPEIKKKHWISKFDASLQFSQAYISPNWYQGGNNNLNMLLNLLYNVKLNQNYHPNLLLEATAQYKLGMNSAPDDSLRNYSISEDLLQFNATFGVKAAKRWYYSLNAQFKTQILHSYQSNTYNLRSAFLSPGDLNVGLGMTYNYANAPKTVTFDASISPLSYNLRICTSDRLDHSVYGIDQDATTVSKFGSSIELKFMWKLSRNITYNSRIFAFTDYSRLYGDWENTLAFAINRFLSTQIYVHLRYDTSTPSCADPSWHKLQVKEILSFGFQYKFSTI